MTEHNDLQHKLVNDVYAELGTISKHSQDVIDYLMRHGWIRTPDEAKAAARGEMPRRTMDKQELIKKIADEYTHLAPAVDTIINAAEHEGWLRNPDQVPALTITESEYRDLELDLSDGNQSFGAVVECLGVTVVPDPEPSNAEKLEIALTTHFGPGAFTVEGGSLSRFLDGIGEKAPGGDDEC